MNPLIWVWFAVVLFFTWFFISTWIDINRTGKRFEEAHMKIWKRDHYGKQFKKHEPQTVRELQKQIGEQLDEVIR